MWQTTNRWCSSYSTCSFIVLECIIILSSHSPRTIKILYFKPTEKLFDAPFIHATTIRIDSLDTSNDSDRLLYLLCADPDPTIHANGRFEWKP